MFALVCYGYLMLFEYILRIKIKSKYANEDNFNLFLNGPNFTRNGIIILVPLIKAIFFTSYSPERYIVQLTKYEYKGKWHSESIDFGDTNYSSVGLAE